MLTSRRTVRCVGPSARSDRPAARTLLDQDSVAVRSRADAALANDQVAVDGGVQQFEGPATAAPYTTGEGRDGRPRNPLVVRVIRDREQQHEQRAVRIGVFPHSGHGRDAHGVASSGTSSKTRPSAMAEHAPHLYATAHPEPVSCQPRVALNSFGAVHPHVEQRTTVGRRGGRNGCQTASDGVGIVDSGSLRRCTLDGAWSPTLACQGGRRFF